MATPNDSRTAPFTFTSALKRLGGDRQLLRELATIFLTDAPLVLDDLKRHIAAQDSAEAAKLAHALKGLVVTFDNADRGLLMSDLVKSLREEEWQETLELLPHCERAIEDLTRECEKLISNSPA